LSDIDQLAGDIRAVAELRGRFTLRSGAESDTYFDKYRFEADPALLRRICQALAALLPDADVLAGLELGGIPLVTVLSQLTGLPAAFIRKAAKPYGTRRYAEGAELSGRRVVLIEDVVSSGGALLAAVRMLRADGIQPLAALCVIDREAGGRAALAELEVPLLALLTQSTLTRAATPVQPR
jgi:orotate phosphoribosyltransferase